MLLLVSLAFAEVTALSDDFEDGSGGSWRPVTGSWYESGGAFHGTQSELGLGAMIYVSHHSLRSDVTFSITTTGTGLGGVIYASSEAGDWCALFAGDGDLFTASSDSPVLTALVDGEPTGADTTLPFTVDRDRLLITHDGGAAITTETPCTITNLAGDAGLIAWPDNGVASFLDFSVGPGGVDADGDGEPDETDCAPEDPTINPAAEEVWYDGVDSDCDGADDYDQDGDGVTVDEDCDDTDRFRYPGKEDIWYDGVDADCAGNDDYDADGDGHAFEGSGGDDCNDGDSAIFPGSEADECDKVDRDCDGLVPVECEDTAADTGSVDEETGGGGGGGGGGDCGCASTGQGGTGGLGLLALVALAGWRRRR